MTRQYDSGLVAPIRTLVREAVVTILAPLASVNGGFVEAIIPIGFKVDRSDDYSIDLLWQELRGKAPAIAVAAIDMVFEPAGAPDRSRGTLAVEIYFVSSHRRGITEGRVESDTTSTTDLTADPGIDVALELAWQALFNTNLGIGARANPMKIRREVELICDDEKTIWHQTWECVVTRDVNKNRNLTQLITQLMSTFKPVGDEPAPRHIVEESDR